MPLPKPSKGEARKDFMSRCMGNGTMNKEFPKQAQRYKVCESQWGKKKSESVRLPNMSVKEIDGIIIWLGTLASYVKSAMMEQKFMSASGPEFMAFADDDGDEDDGFQGYGYMVNQYNGTAVIDVSGPLITQSNWLTRMFGLTGYDEVRNAVVAAAENESVSNILLDIDSPGGSANGVEEAADAIKSVDAGIKPVYSYTGGTMASAAYWLGSSAREVYATPMASVGSIGVIATHMEVTELLKKEGIKPTLFRSGEKKALGGQYEKLSDAATQEIQSKVNELGGHFVSTVAANRGRTTDYMQEQVGDGREFWGKDAVGVGLLDGLKSFEEVVKLLDNDHNSTRAGNVSDQPTGESDMLRKKAVAMTPEAQAAIASGVPVDTALQSLAQGDSVSPVADDQGDPGEGPAASATPDLETQPAEGEPAAECDLTDVVDPPAPPIEGNAVASLVQELSTAKTDLAQATVSLQQAEASLVAAETDQTGLLSIAIASINQMQIGLGSPAEDLSMLSAGNVVTKYHATRELFTSRFPVGGKAEVPIEDNRNTPENVVDHPTAQAAARATRIR